MVEGDDTNKIFSLDSISVTENKTYLINNVKITNSQVAFFSLEKLTNPQNLTSTFTLSNIEFSDSVFLDANDLIGFTKIH